MLPLSRGSKCRNNYRIIVEPVSFMLFVRYVMAFVRSFHCISCKEKLSGSSKLPLFSFGQFHSSA